MGMDREDQPLSFQNQPLSDKPLSSEDRETQALAALYGKLADQHAAARQRRIATGKATFSDLDERGRRAYALERQRECRARQRAHAETTGHAPISIDAIRGAVLDAAMLMIATGDDRADAILTIASKAFELPAVAASTIRRKSRSHQRKVLTDDRLKRTP